MVERFDRSLRDLSPCSGIHRGITIQFREPGIVDLQDKASLNDRLVLVSQCVAHRVQVLFIAAVVFIVANAAWGHRWHESFLRSQATKRSLQILNVFFYCLLPSIADRPGAD